MSIQQIQAQGENWIPNLWEFYFIGSPEIIFRVKRTSLPFIHFTFETINSGHKYLTGYEPEAQFSIDFLESQNLDLIKFFEEWENSIYDKQERVFKKGQHTKDAILLIQKPKLNAPGINIGTKVDKYETVKTYLFSNMVFLGLENITLDYENGNGKIITANFIADTVKPTTRGKINEGISPLFASRVSIV